MLLLSQLVDWYGASTTRLTHLSTSYDPFINSLDLFLPQLSMLPLGKTQFIYYYNVYDCIYFAGNPLVAYIT